MNTRIRQLAEQASIHFSRVGILDGDPNGSARMVGYSKIEKFAELIVEECARRAEAYAYMSPNFTALAEELRRMNGVEE